MLNRVILLFLSIPADMHPDRLIFATAVVAVTLYNRKNCGTLQEESEALLYEDEPAFGILHTGLPFLLFPHVRPGPVGASDSFAFDFSKATALIGRTQSVTAESRPAAV
jgi:hypothetical protein